MGLLWRFISASAGMVTFVIGEPCRERSPPAEKLVRLIMTPVPLRGLRMRPEQVRVYAPRGRNAPPLRCCNGTSPPTPDREFSPSEFAHSKGLTGADCIAGQGVY